MHGQELLTFNNYNFLDVDIWAVFKRSVTLTYDI